MGVIKGPENGELKHLTDVERADPVDIASPALTGEAEILRELREALDYRTAMSEFFASSVARHSTLRACC